MKSFKEYLTESKKVYEFKVKIAGECPKDTAASIKAALSQFKVESCSAGKRTPIQEHQADFPEHKNVEMTIFEVTTSYPATSMQVRDAVAARVGATLSTIKVCSEAEEREHELNHANDEKTGESLLGKDYPASNNQDLVGEKHTMSMLKELSKTKHTGTEYTGVNDELLAKTAPVDKAQPTAKTTNKTISTTSPIGTKPTKLPAMVKGR